MSSKQFADECLETARSERERPIFLRMAQTWLQAAGLAEQREGGLNVDNNAAGQRRAGSGPTR